MSSSSARKITVEFIGNDKSLGKTAKSVEAKTSTLGAKMQKVGNFAGKALAGGALIAAAGLYKMGQAAADDEAAATKLAAALKNNAGATDATVAATEKWITAQGKALGVTDDELRPAIARLVTATHDVGKAQDLASLAMDVSAGSGKSLEAVSTALMKAQNGQVSSLARLGINTKNAAGETISMDEATKRMAKTFGGQAAKAAETTAGKQKRLQVTLSELGEEIGARVLPAMLKLSDVGLKMVDWVSKNQKKVAVLVAALTALAAVVWTVGVATRVWTAATTAAAAAQAVWAATMGLSNSLLAVWIGVKYLEFAAWVKTTAATVAATAASVAHSAAVMAASLATKAWAAGQWLLNAALTANPIGLVVIAIAALAAGLIFAYKKSETFRKIVDKAFSVVKAGGAAVLGFFKRNWPLLLAIITGPFGLAVYAVAKHWDTIKAGVSAVKGFIVDKFVALLVFFRGLPSRFAGAAVGMFDGVKNAFKDALNWIIGKWNDFEISMPAIDTHIPGVGTVGGFSLGTPNIPYLAKGGVVKATRGGTLALLGEGGHDEAVVPLSGPNARSMGGGNIIVNIHGALDPVAVGRQIEQILVKYAATMSRPLQVRTLS